MDYLRTLHYTVPRLQNNLQSNSLNKHNPPTHLFYSKKTIHLFLKKSSNCQPAWRGFWDSRDTSSSKYLFAAQQQWFIIAALLIQLICLTKMFLNKPLPDRVFLCFKSLTNLLIIWSFAQHCTYHAFHLQKDLSSSYCMRTWNCLKG